MANIVATCTRSLGVSFEKGVPWDPFEVLDTWRKVIPRGGTIVMTSRTYYEEWVQSSDAFDRWRAIVLTREPGAHIPRANVAFRSVKNWHADELTALSAEPAYYVGGPTLFDALHCGSRIHLNILDQHTKCDRFLRPPLHNQHTLITTYTGVHWGLSLLLSDKAPSPCFDDVYTGLARRVLASNDALDAPNEAMLRDDRTGTKTYSIFGDQIRFDISKHVPLLTTKHVPWRQCVEELLWFLHGCTNAYELSSRGVRVWDANSSREFLDKSGLSHLREFDCGANYSFQWRFFGQKYVDCDTAYEPYTASDQIANIIHLLRTDPTSRRMVLSAWNPCDLANTVLPPCHMSAQFYVRRDGALCCHMYQRSCDVFLGLPWNIFSYTALTYLLAKITGYVPGELVISFGDVHVYSDHWNQIKTQMERPPLASPMLVISNAVKEKRIEDITLEDFQVFGYLHHPHIKAQMSV